MDTNGVVDLTTRVKTDDSFMPWCRFFGARQGAIPALRAAFCPKELALCDSANGEERRIWEVPRSAIAQSRSHGRPRKYVASHHSDKMIRSAFIDFRKHGDRTILRNASLRLGWPSHAVSRRARELGVAPVTQQRPWSRQELAILKRGILFGAETIRRQLREKGFHRSISSILAEKRSAMFPFKMHYSAREVAFGLGIDPHKVLLWIRRGHLSAQRSMREASRWMISADAVRTFVFTYPDQFDLAQADKFWLLKLLRGEHKKERCSSVGSIRKK